MADKQPSNNDLFEQIPGPEPSQAEPAEETYDPFDPASLRLSQNYGESLGVQRLLLTVPVRKPSKESWVRTHPDESYRLRTLVLELKEGDREIYLIHPQLWGELVTEPTVSARLLITTITRQNVVTLWPIRLPGDDGKIDDWNRSALEAANVARDTWVRVSANMSLGAYDVSQAKGDFAEPQWPTESFRDLLKVAFKDRFIDSLEHPVLKRLRGEL